MNELQFLELGISIGAVIMVVVFWLLAREKKPTPTEKKPTPTENHIASIVESIGKTEKNFSDAVFGRGDMAIREMFYSLSPQAQEKVLAELPPEGKRILQNPELSVFEDTLRVICESAVKEAYLFPDRRSEDFAKLHAPKLLEVAREELRCRQGLVTMNHLNVACNAEYESGRAMGKKEFLEELPHWRKYFGAKRYNDKPIIIEKLGPCYQLLYKGKFIAVDDLLKLPDAE